MNRREAEELLPWYVAGTLSHEEMQAVRAFIDSGEIAAEQVDEMAFVGEALAETGAEEPRYDPLILQRVMDQLDDVPQSARADEPLVVVRERQPGWLGRGLASLRERLQWSATPPLARVAIAAQFALLLAVAVAFSVGGGTDEPGYEVVSGRVAGDYSVTFAPGVTEAQLRTLLLENGATIVAGPSAIGLYAIEFDGDVNAAEAAERLNQSPAVSFIQATPAP